MAPRSKKPAAAAATAAAPSPPSPTTTKPGPRVIMWYRTDLRLHDSPALTAALSLSPSALFPIWTWDPHYVYRARVGSNRWQFLLDCQRDLSASLTALNANQKLFVLREAPQTVLRKIFRDWKIDYLVFERDTDAYARERDENIMHVAGECGVKVITRAGRTLWDSDEVVKANGGKPTMSATQLGHAGEKIGEIARPLAGPTWLPDPDDLSEWVKSVKNTVPEAAPDVNARFRVAADESYAKGIAGPNDDFAPPTMQELGLEPATTPHRGGETLALEIVRRVCADKEYCATFEKPKTAPTAFAPQSTCLTSPHLHFGSLSVRYFWYEIQKVLESYKGSPSRPPASLQGQLLFRDMYFAAQAALGWKFGQTYDNSHCRFVPWHLPSKVDIKTGLITGEYEIDDEEKERQFQRWKNGTTGFPWIDAAMRQLRQEGWIHHLARHAVACFLTRGGMYCSWERGAEVFEELLIDHETACNAGNWQWLSCTAFFAQFYRCYSPIAFPQKWDKQGDYVRRYVPELANFPAKYIYEPWKAPIADQKAAGVLIKGDGSTTTAAAAGEEKEGGLKVYPKPMLDFNVGREKSIQGMKAAYHVKLYGDDPKVKDGSWRKLFEDAGEGPTEGEQGGPGGMTYFEGEDDNGQEETTPRKPTTDKSSTNSPGSKRKGQATLDGAFKKQKA